MTYATVMVSLALNQPNNARLQVAGELAERYEAALVGVAAAKFAPPIYFTDGAAAQRLINQEEVSVKRCLADLEAEFHAATRTRAGRGMAQLRRFSRAIRPGAGALRRHRGQWRTEPGLLRCVFAGKPEGSGDAGRPTPSGRA
ncbi:hypothetical protein ACVWW5_006859 [Bradyrhizobium sp. LM3.4]